MPCPRHGLIQALIMWPMHVPDMSYTLVSILMPCPRHDLTLALIMWPMHVPDMSYTSSHK
ncbi:hypothetical protein F383_03795 [Gossypium arboreum]|uniref:Uncharacterized protein n=1 Tax=Gossypium arboreum TaxID=29729 RepID=A0A0B0PGP3_GOSAR|nr:hypothetical protein F383_03795 [Gossypium arboreum]